MRQMMGRIRKLIRLAFKGSAKILLSSLLIFFIIRVLGPGIQPLTITWIFDSLEKGDVKEVVMSLTAVAALTAFNGVMLYLLQVYLDTWADLITHACRMEFIKKLVEKPYGSLRARYEKGDLVNRVDAVAKTVFFVLLHPCSMLAKIVVCIYFTFMLNRFNWQVWCVVACVFTLILIAVKIQVKLEVKWNGRVQKAYGEKENITRELIYQVDFYRMTNLNGYIFNEYRKQRDEMFSAVFRQMLCGALFAMFHDMVALCGKAIILLLVYPVVLAGGITAGIISSLVFIYDKIIEQLEGMRAVVVELPRQTVSIDRYYEIIDSMGSKDLGDTEYDMRIKVDGLNLELNGVHILHDINLTLNMGEKVALIGNNGSGKSTLMKAMLGMYDEDLTGNICYSTEQLIKRSSYIPTDPQLFQGTVTENICSSGTGLQKALLEEMWLYPDVAEVREHYKDELSEGQKQMVNILRGCYKGAEILFADEVTSSIDISRRQKVMSGLMERCCTMLCITHNREDLAWFDRIMVMENGRIVAEGTLDEVEKTEPYQRWLHS